MDVHSPRITLSGDGTSQLDTLARWVNRHKGTSLVSFTETNFTFSQSKDCKVSAKPYVFARVPFGAALTNDNVSRNNVLAAELLDAKPLTR